MGEQWPEAYVQARRLAAADPDLGGIGRAVPLYRPTVTFRRPKAEALAARRREAEVLLAARCRAGLCQREVAAWLGVAQQTVSQYERGTRRCPELVRVRWLAVCGG